MLLAVAASSICTGQSLRQQADGAGVLIGTAVRPSQFSEAAYASTLAREFSMVEPEDAMKWRALRPGAKTYDFRQGDEVVRFAQVHGMKTRGHCLVWDHDNPDWLAQGHFTPRRLSQLLRQHITRVMKHYKDHVFAWDVINEGLDENGNVRNSIWYNQPGIGLSGRGSAYIEQVFRWAHKADPHALLFYNEAEGEALNRKSDAIYAMLRDFKRRGVPIDGVGLQMHVPALDTDMAAFTAGLSANMQRLTALGLQIHITELDVAVPLDAKGAPRPEDLALEADIYRGVVKACLAIIGCTAIQTWGFTDKYSWIGSHSRGARGQGLPFDRLYQPKSAYRAVWEELSAGRASARSSIAGAGIDRSASNNKSASIMTQVQLLQAAIELQRWRLDSRGADCFNSNFECFQAQAIHHPARDVCFSAAGDSGLANRVRSHVPASGK